MEEDLERAARRRCRRGLSGSDGAAIAEEVEEDGVGVVDAPVTANGLDGRSGDCVFEPEKL